MNRRHIAITGGRGRLAPLVAAHLRQAGAEVVLFSRSGGKGFAALPDLLRPETLEAYDAIVHMAWSTVPLTAEENPGVEDREDLPLLEALLAVSRRTRHAPHFVFLSTAAVYGNTGHVPVSEEESCQPVGRYARAKLRAEEMLRKASPENSCALRVSNVFGVPVHSSKPQGIITRLFEATHGGRPVTIWGDGSGAKDYLYHQDFLEAIQAVLARGLCGTFNVASGQMLSLHEIISLVEESCGRRLAVEYRPHFPWDVERACISSEKLFAEAGWRARHDVVAAIRQLIRS